MKPLLVLIVAFLLALATIRLTTGNADWQLAGRIAMSLMLLFTTIGHFKFTKGMESMLPQFLPGKNALVIGTGFVEIAAAAGLLIPGLSMLTGWLLILFFLLILPANIRAAMLGIDYETGEQKGPGPRYLWFRVPLQLWFIGWVYVTTLWQP